MKKMYSVLSLGIAATFTLSGCATIFGGGDMQKITVNSDESKNMSVGYLNEKDNSVDVIQTFNAPSVITVNRESKDLVIKSTDTNCEEIVLEKKLNPWFWGNVVATSLLSSTVDAVTGAMWEYDDTVSIECSK
ncbi:hypothetical protein [Poseidonibacter antarcticus]|uniref:hypothetical protein n=1 Tax=Poseidonibacter antarcticus TaxID=2478538 RepID=UPI000EF4ED3E|nr:hypothetical protein [Poseidonibacter antarcticus]